MKEISEDPVDPEWESVLKKAFSRIEGNNPPINYPEQEKSHKPIYMGNIKGQLIAKRIGISTLSEGWEYFIHPIDQYQERWEEILVRKHTPMWQDDPQLQPMIGKIVQINGDIIETKSTITIDWVEIDEL